MKRFPRLRENEVSNKASEVFRLKRSTLIDRARKQRAEIHQYFEDIEYWNDSRTKFEQIEADPDGELQVILSGLDAMLSQLPSVKA